MSDLVSIVLPIYNQEKYLDISIPEILRQTYKNLEILLVDDGSTDSSPMILERFAANDDRIKIITKPNGGLVDATITGIRNATGRYICFMDPDDEIGPEFVETFAKNIDDCDFIAMGFLYKNANEVIPNPLDSSRVFLKKDIELLRHSYLYDRVRPVVSNQVFISRWNKMYRLDLVKKVIEKFENYTHISLGEDTIFTFLMLNEACKGKALADTNQYFYNISSQTSMVRNGQIEGHLIKAKNAYDSLHYLLTENHLDCTQAYFLYFTLIESLVNRVKRISNVQLIDLFHTLKRDSIYSNACKVIIKSCGMRRKLDLFFRLNFKSGKMYCNLMRLLRI